MDFTYFIAGFIALIVGSVAGLVFVTLRGESKRRLLATAVAVAVIIDFGLLINWRHIGEAPAILLFDIVFFAVYSVVGCAVGASPALIGRLAWRKWRARAHRFADSS